MATTTMPRNAPRLPEVADVWNGAKWLVAAMKNSIGIENSVLVREARNARRAFLASRTNTLFSIPMLFFMAATSHFAPFHTSATSSKRGAFLGIVVVVTAVLELNALGVLGGVQPGGARAYLDQHRNTIIAGFVYAALLIILFEAFFS